jgi:hypothetical protein
MMLVLNPINPPSVTATREGGKLGVFAGATATRYFDAIAVELRGYPVISRIRKLLLSQEVRTLHPRRSMLPCASPTPPTSATHSGPSSSP